MDLFFNPNGDNRFPGLVGLTCINILYTIILEMTKNEFPEIPGYIIKRKLGEGGMANVYLALQEKLEREVAIKVLDTMLLKDEQTLKRFKKEAQTAAKLTHPNIITVYDVGKSGDTHYIVMEYLKESLRDRIKSKVKLPPSEALGIIKKIAEALSDSHSKGIIHRDIKPDNIMFRPDGSPVLVDFGIAHALDFTTRLTVTGMRVGTPNYMSPEQCKGEEIDGRSDIYSLGIVLFELLTGKVPYTSEYPTGLIYLHTQGPIPELPPGLNKYQPLLEAMMAKQKDARIKNGAKLLKQIKLLEKGQMPLAYDKLSGRDSPAPLKGKRVLAWVPLIVILLGLSVYFIFIHEGKKNTVSPARAEKRISANRVKEKGSQTPVKPPEDKKTNQIKRSEENNKPVKKVNIEKSDEKTGNTKKVPVLKQTDLPPVPEKEITPKEVKPEQDEVEVLEEKKVKTLNFVNLPREVIANMNKEIKRMEILNLEQGITVGGEIELNLSVDENGRVLIKQFDDSRLILNREEKKEMVKEMILKEIGQISFRPLTDEAGEPQKIENWRKTYKLGTFKGKIILY